MIDIRDQLVDFVKPLVEADGRELTEFIYIALTRNPEDPEGKYYVSTGAGFENHSELRHHMLNKAMEIF